jgi:hypothetical protein
LKRRLYSTLATTIAPKLNAASEGFLENIRKEVRGIETDAMSVLSLKTEFALPTDLGALFEILDFDTQDAHSQTSLRQRGDGMQGRLVPLILKFLADQRKVNSPKGKPSAETIWGYEEPENNLEPMQQMLQAAQFSTYSSGLQIIATTHSPTFYNEAATKIFARRNEGCSHFENVTGTSQVDEAIGLMPFLAPYLKNAENDRNRILAELKAVNQSALINANSALIVEGRSDQIILTAVFTALGHSNLNFQIHAESGVEGGANWVVSHTLGRAALTELRFKTAALFDADDAGKSASSKLDRDLTAIQRRDRVRIFTLGKDGISDAVKAFRSKQITISVGIEAMLDLQYWNHARKQNWLVERTSLLSDNQSLITDKSQTFNDVLSAKIPPTDPGRLMIDNKLNTHHKEQFAKYVGAQLLTTKNVPATLAVLGAKLVEYFEENLRSSWAVQRYEARRHTGQARRWVFNPTYTRGTNERCNPLLHPSLRPITLARCTNARRGLPRPTLQSHTTSTKLSAILAREQWWLGEPRCD